MTHRTTHLTFEEILSMLRSREQGVFRSDLEEHLSSCSACKGAKEQLETIIARLDSPVRTSQPTVVEVCPASGLWNHLAAGALPTEVTRDLLDHLSHCHRCGVLLKEALEDLKSDAPVDPEVQSQLETSRPRWQGQIAGEIVSGRFQKGSGRPATFFQKKHAGMFRWARAAAVVLLIAAVGGGGFLWLRPNSAEKLLAQAYAKQRTLELRIPGAHYGPLQVQRGAAHSQHNSSAALLEAELIIKRGLEKQSPNPDLLQQQAEADLLNWDFQLAIDTLGHALRMRRPSPSTLVDLASAHFERAEANDSPADYESALHYLGEALRLSPADHSALFNRAIIYERLFLYDPAIADWEKLLAMEKDTEWRNEEESRLRDLRLKYQHRNSNDPARPFSALEMEQALERNQQADAEEYLKSAERELLPNISQPRAQDLHYRVALLTAGYLRRVHDDPFLNDLLQSAKVPGFHSAAQLLAEASIENGAGHSEQAYTSAQRSARLFQQLGSPAGMLAAEFEEAYALRFQTQAGTCATVAAGVALGARQHDYPWLETQSLLENAFCIWMKNDLGAAKVMVKDALRIAQAHNYQSFYLRALLALGHLEAESGDEYSAWSAIRQGLQIYWSGRFPPMRGYSFYTVLESISERQGHDNVQLAAASEALTFISGDPDQMVEAAARSRLAAVALRLGEMKIAEEQYAQALKLFSSMPQTSSVRWRMIQAELWRAKAQARQSGYSRDALAALLELSPEVKRLSNGFVEFEYYSTVAEIQWKRGEQEAAEQTLRTAIGLSESGLRSLPTWPERLTWMNQHRSPYLLLTELLFGSGRQQAALAVWQRFRSAAAQPPEKLDVLVSFRESALGRDHTSEVATILTFALTSDGVLLWLRGPRGLHSAYVTVADAEVKRVAEEFLEQCSRPDSDLSLVRADGHSLYGWLVAPVSQWLPAAGSLLVESDAVLNTLPLEALVDERGAYLGTRYSIITALAGGKTRTASSPLVQSSDRVLLVAAPAGPATNLEPPAQALREAKRIAGKFLNSEILSGRDATFAALKKELSAAQVFHFAGHATVGRGGAAIMMADGVFGVTGPGRRGNHVPDEWSERALQNVKLAVFSACATARPSEALRAESLVSRFIQSGVPWVTASRWNVDSVATTGFMLSFYDSLLSGHTVDSALQLAARDVRASSAWTHPYYWAAFGVFGHS